MKRKETAMSRRGFLEKGGHTLAAAAAAPALLSACGGTEQQVTTETSALTAPPYGPYKMGFQSYSLRHFSAWDDFLREARKLDLRYVELYRGHLDHAAPAEQVMERKQELAASGLQANAFGVERFTADHEKNKALFEFAKLLGVANLSADPMKDAFASLERLVQEYDIQIAIHNHGPEDERWRMPEWILDAVKDLDPRIGACADLGHFIRAGVDPVEAIEMLGSRVLGVHFKDFDEQGNDVVIGRGSLDTLGVLQALRKINFDGPLSLEFEGDREDPVPNILECLASIREAVAQL